jgi:hypothetical protein
MTTEFFLVTPKSVLKMFVLDTDREYFAQPVRVELHHSDVSDRTLYVRDPRGNVYPVNKADVRPTWRLSKRQRKGARS